MPTSQADKFSKSFLDYFTFWAQKQQSLEETYREVTEQESARSVATSVASSLNHASEKHSPSEEQMRLLVDRVREEHGFDLEQHEVDFETYLKVDLGLDPERYPGNKLFKAWTTVMKGFKTGSGPIFP